MAWAQLFPSVVWHRFPNIALDPIAPSPHPLNTNPTGADTTNNVRAGSDVDQPRLWRLVICYGFYGFGYIFSATDLPAQARILLQESWIYSLAWPVFVMGLGERLSLSLLLAASVLLVTAGVV